MKEEDKFRSSLDSLFTLSRRGFMVTEILDKEVEMNEIMRLPLNVVVHRKAGERKRRTFNLRDNNFVLARNLGSISPMFYEQLLRKQIPNAQKRLSS